MIYPIVELFKIFYFFHDNKVNKYKQQYEGKKCLPVTWYSVNLLAKKKKKKRKRKKGLTQNSQNGATFDMSWSAHAKVNFANCVIISILLTTK